MVFFEPNDRIAIWLQWRRTLVQYTVIQLLPERNRSQRRSTKDRELKEVGNTKKTKVNEDNEGAVYLIEELLKNTSRGCSNLRCLR